MIYHSYQKELKFVNAISLYAIWMVKKNYVLHIRSLKQALIYGLILQKVHRLIQFNQEAWLKHYIGMIAKLRPEAKNNFKSDIFKLMNNAVFGKTMEI